MVYIVMGVSGCGKSTIGALLAQQLNLPFFDADDFHSESNIKKMREGIPLGDDDRLPWLQVLARHIHRWQETGAILACSALRQRYRDILVGSSADDVTFVYLKGSFDLIQKRLLLRTRHYMSPALLKSQFDILEEPVGCIDMAIDSNPEEIVSGILSLLNKATSP